MYWTGWMSALVVAVALVALGGGAYVKGRSGGYEKRDLECRAEVSTLKTNIANLQVAKARAEAEALRERDGGIKVAASIAEDLLKARAKIDQLQRSLDDEIRNRASATRRALDGQLVRLLNTLSPIRESGGSSTSEASTTAPGMVSTIPTTPTDQAGYSASERSVATALRECRIGYTSCAAQHEAWIRWSKTVSE